MSHSTPTPSSSSDGALPSSLPEFASRVYAYTAQFPRNLHTAITSPSSKDYLRLVTIVGAYVLVRPWIEKFFAWWMDAPAAKSLAQARAAEQEERELDPATGLPRTLQPKARAAAVGAAAIRGQQPQAPGEKARDEAVATSSAVEPSAAGEENDDDDDDDETAVARKRQQKAMLEAYEKEQKKSKAKKKVPGTEGSGARGGKEGYDPVLLEGWDY